MAFDRTANLVGALALRVADEMDDAVATTAGVSMSGAAALSALLHFLDRPTIDRLRQVLGLTSSGTVRLVDRLEGAGHVTRTSGADARSTLISLTPSGRRAARRVAAARAAVLERVLAPLSAADRRALDGLVSKLLVGLIREPGATRWTCRLCDTGACGRDRGECPVAAAALARYG